MAFDANNMQVFSQRCQNFATTLWSAFEEGERLYQIYLNETSSGADPDFDDTSIATKQEHIDLIVLYLAFRDFVDGNAAVPQVNRQPNLTPFLQQQ